MDIEKRIKNIENNFNVFLKLLTLNCSNQLEVAKVASNFNSLVEISKQSEEHAEKIKIIYNSYLKILEQNYPKMYPLLKKELKELF